MSLRRAASVGLCLLGLSLSSTMSGQSAAGPAVDEFGIQDGNDLWIPASRFTGYATLMEGETGYFFSTAAAAYGADVALPQGALLDSWRVFYDDASASNNLTITFYKYFDDTTASPANTRVLLSQFISSGTPGITNHHEIENRTIDLREPSGPAVTRNQAADFYGFVVILPNDPFVELKGVRLVWHRQVSPAPAVATFTDVPTSDPAFQFIEALAASGITAGCNVSPAKYCPDDTLTRRQMAVFLAKALGLHWPGLAQ